MNAKNIIRKLVSVPAVSGFEKELGISDLIFSFFSCFDSKIDELGNVVVKISSGRKKIVIDAHIDEVGFKLVKNNLIAVGDIEEKEIKKTLIKIDDKLKVGYFNRYFVCDGDLVRSPALDNKAGCAALIMASEKLSRLDADIYLCFTAQEETTGNGIKKILSYIKPNILICLDSAYAKPYRKKGCTIPELTKGPAVQTRGKNFETDCVSLVRKIAYNNKIPVQFEIVKPDMGATNLTFVDGKFDKIQINVPVRFQHSSVSECSLMDIENTSKIVYYSVKSLLFMNY